MTISERSVGDVRVLDLAGPITLGHDGADLLSDKVRSLLQQGYKRMVLNLAGVPYMDSTGLGAMVHAHVTAARQGGCLKLLNSTRKLQDLLVITKLSMVFDSFDDEASAVGSFRDSA